jgi:uncharacterized protein
MKMGVTYQSVARCWSAIVFKRSWIILIVALFLTVLALVVASGLSVSTRLEDLMPEDAKSVQALNAVLKKSGSFASIQIVARSNDEMTTREFLHDAKTEIDKFDWVEFSQYSEDVEFLTRHKLVLLDEEELLKLERDVEDAYPVFLAQELAKAVGTDVSFTVRSKGLHGDSQVAYDHAQIDALTQSLQDPPQKKRYFTTQDGLTGVLVVWPKQGLESLNDAKRIVDDIRAATQTISAAQNGAIQAGVAGRIANKVAQFDAVTADLRLSLFSAVILIALLIAVFYRSLFATPVIFIPLCFGLVWTFGLTSLVIGGLNLITIFLVLILFGLGIDFGIHNLSRYQEERQAGCTVYESINAIIADTGGASALAALTTSIGFFALMFTKFRAFSEFGFIAGSGIVLIYLSMYSVFPALIVIYERTRSGTFMGRPQNATERKNANRFLSRKYAMPIAVIAIVFAAVFAPQISFERNFKNLEANQPASLVWATNEASKVFGSSHDRAIIAVDSLNDLATIVAYFEKKIAVDRKTPTIEKVSSVFDLAPPVSVQAKRMEIIDRLKDKARKLRSIDHALYESAMQYLDIDMLEIKDLPEAVRRTFVGSDQEPGYLFYIYNSVSMDDARLAREFYDDAAYLSVDGKEYASASEGFIFVEMIALMKMDALRAILLVAFVTAALLLFATRSLVATMIILAPPMLGVLVTIAIMGAIGLPLSIMNMVILPSLIGIAVDNAIHIFHRYQSEGKGADISKIMNTTGRAAILTTLTTLVGFGGLVTASMGGLQSMGVLAIIGFSTCLTLTWLLLPGLLSLYRRKAQEVRRRLVTY